MKRIFLLVTLGVLTIAGCKKEKNDGNNQTSDPEALSAEEVTILDNLPQATGISASTIVLPNGEILGNYVKKIDSSFYKEWMKTTADPYANLTPDQAKNALIGKVTMIALKLTDRSKYQKPNEGVNKPAQNGLAYRWGGKDHTVRMSSSKGSVCTDEVFGLDCSGFIKTLFESAGVHSLPGWADAQRQEDNLKNAVKNSIPALNNVIVEDLGAIATSKFETGDIIYWEDNKGIATHIGIILKDINGNLAVFQSNGSAGNNVNDCSKNLGLTRGPRRIQLGDPYWFGKNKIYGITRINTDNVLEGIWKIDLTLGNGNCDETLLEDEAGIPPTLHFNADGTIVFDTDPQGSNLNGTGFNNRYTFSKDTLKIKSHYVDQWDNIKFDATLIYNSASKKFSGTYTNRWTDNTVCTNTVVVTK